MDTRQDTLSSGGSSSTLSIPYSAYLAMISRALFSNYSLTKPRGLFRGGQGGIAFPGARSDFPSSGSPNRESTTLFASNSDDPNSDDETYFGSYSTIVTDWRQWRAIVVFSLFLLGLPAIANVGAALWLSNIYHQPVGSCWESIVLGGPCGGFNAANAKRAQEAPGS